MLFRQADCPDQLHPLPYLAIFVRNRMIAWKDFAMDDTYFLSLTMFLGVRLVLFWCVGKYSRNRESK